MKSINTKISYASPDCDVTKIIPEGIFCGSPYSTVESPSEETPLEW